MKIRIIIYISLIFISFLAVNKSHAQTNFKIIATVNNKAITLIDLKKEIYIAKILNKEENKIENNFFNKKILNNLIEDSIKKEEIKKEKINVSKIEIEKFLQEYLINAKSQSINIENIEIEELRNKIELSIGWNKLISKKYISKVNINLFEISNRIESNKNNYQTNEKENIKEQIKKEEFNKKLRVFERYHLNKIKKNSLIKIFL